MGENSHKNLAKPEETLAQLISQPKVQHHMEVRETDEEALAFHANERNHTSAKFLKRTNSNNQAADSAGDRRAVECTYYKRSGHGWKECRKLKSDNERKRISA